MSWKERLGLEKYVINEEVDVYLLSHGFEYSEMSPRYMNDESHFSSIEHLHKPCLKLVAGCPKNKGDVVRVYINKSEVYKEIECSWSSFRSSNHIEFRYSNFNTESVDEILDALLS